MPLLKQLDIFLQNLSAPAQLLIAYSGGVDSHVLLHALVQCVQQQDQPITLRAIHLNHGLNPLAHAWQQHAQQVCADLHIPLITHDLQLIVPAGESIEAHARTARYAYFAQVLKSTEILCTAHHQDDQLETVLLQLLRGAGPKGLAAMADRRTFAQGEHARPLLNIDKAMIMAYAAQHHLAWINDDSNHNLQFDRNFLRQQVIPVLKKRFSAAAHTFNRAAHHCASTQDVLETYLRAALSDLAGDFPQTLSRNGLAQLPAAKQAYLLRTWLSDRNIPLPSTQQLTQIQALLTIRNDAKAVVTWGEYSARFYQNSLFVAHHDFFQAPLIMEIFWDGKTPLDLPWGRLSLVSSPHGTLSPRILQQPLKISFRQNGVRCHLAGKTHSQALKKLLQAAHMPPWQRWQLPLIYVGDELAAIGDQWVTAAYACMPGEIGLAVNFSPL